MHTAADDNTFSLANLFVFASKSCDDKHVHVVARAALAKSFAPKPKFFLRVGFQCVKVAIQIRKCVWVAVGEVNGVVVIIELHSKC